MPSYAWDQGVAQFLSMDAAGTSNFGDVIASIGAGVQGEMEAFTGRTLGLADYDEYYDGRDRSRLFLRKDPVASVTSLTIFGNVYTVGVPGTADAVITSTRDSLLMLEGSVFPWGIQNIHVVYKAGFAMDSPEAATFIRAGALWIAQIFKNRDNIGRSSIVRANGQQDNFRDSMPEFVKQALLHLQRAAVPTC